MPYRYFRARRDIGNTFSMLGDHWKKQWMLGRFVWMQMMITDAATSPVIKYTPPNFADGITASGEHMLGEWRRLVSWLHKEKCQVHEHPRLQLH